MTPGDLRIATLWQPFRLTDPECRNPRPFPPREEREIESSAGGSVEKPP
jgi:hypothetical protein